MIKLFLSENWEYRKAEKGEAWKPAVVPGNIHLDLLRNNDIPDPYYRDNETALQWIGECDWEYRCSFEADNLPDQGNIDLIFEGLDTYADVYLNDQLILNADNMYCGWRINAENFLLQGSNELRVLFHSVIKRTLPLYLENGFEYGANNSQPEPKLSIYSRKPGYHFGWDWGPRLLTCGVWRPVYFEFWNYARIDNARFVQKSVSKNSAAIQMEVEIISLAETEVNFRLEEFKLHQDTFKIHKGANKIIIEFDIQNPRLWWCRGLGEQNLYNISLSMFNRNIFLDSWKDRIGLRTLELIHEPDENGKSFYFKLNGIPVFIKGSNCLPPDYFIPRISGSDYRKLIQNAYDANMNMLRLWGGAVYEEDEFYKLCDEYGIMVWQDFMFACAMYPADDVMSTRIKMEAEYNIKRIRNHPCLALWCGNNEIDEGWHTWGWQERYNYSKENCDLIWGYYKKIFDEILPQAVKQFDPERPYWPSSPKFGFVDERSKTDGDMHYWGVWFLNHPKEKFKEYIPRFMSEYGLQSMPEIKTIKEYSLSSDWSLSSSVMSAHQRQYPNLKKGQKLGGYDMMLKYLESEYTVPDDFGKLSYVSQLLQADYLKSAIETHRRCRPYCMGTMYWQLNDLWPVTSWSTVDYYGRWKAAHYAVRRAYAPVISSVFIDQNLLKVFLINDLLQEKKVRARIKIIDFSEKKIFDTRVDLVIHSNSVNICFEEDINNYITDTAGCLCNVTVTANHSVIDDNIFYFNNTNQLKLQKPIIDYRISCAETEYCIVFKSDVLVKNLFIRIHEPDGFLTDNYFDLLPGVEKAVTFYAKDLWDKELSLLHYQQLQ